MTTFTLRAKRARLESLCYLVQCILHATIEQNTHKGIETVGQGNK